MSSKDSGDECGEYDEEELNAAMQSEKKEAELGQGDSRDLDYFEGDGELVEGDASPVLESVVKEQESGEVDSVDCKVEDALGKLFNRTQVQHEYHKLSVARSCDKGGNWLPALWILHHRIHG